MEMVAIVLGAAVIVLWTRLGQLHDQLAAIVVELKSLRSESREGRVRLDSPRY